MIEKLNEYQIEAIKSDQPNIVVVAEAGAGKSTTLIYAAIEYRHKHPKEKIDIITYTRAATADLVEKLAKEGVTDCNVSTIHVWSRERLQELAKLYHFYVKILEEPAIKEILKMIVNEHRVKVNPDILYNYIMGSKKMDVSQNYLRSLEALNKRYIAYKRTNNLYDFTDYPLYLLNKLNEYNEKIYSCDALFVDELQDVDEEQAAVFSRVEASKKFFIGDEKQAIYYFRGADAEIFQRLDDFHYKKLNVNYRSYQEIIDYATTVYEEINSRLGYIDLVSKVDYSKPSTVVCARKTGGKVFVMDPFGHTIEINGATVNTATTTIEFLNKKPMILCRTNKQVRGLQDLGYEMATTVHQAKGLEYDYVVAIDAPIESKEDLNVAYVALTRARDGLFVANYQQLCKLVAV